MKLHCIAWVGLSASALGCTGQVYEETTARTTESPLRSAMSAERRVIRALVPGCDPITTITGTWNGEPLHADIGTNNAFCAYEWSPVRKDAPPDETALSNRAMRNRHEAYVVRDVRASNRPVPSMAPPAVNDFTSLAPRGGGNPPTRSGTLTTRSAVPTRVLSSFGSNPTSPPFEIAIGASASVESPTPFNLTAVARRQPDGESGCEVCAATWDHYLWFVLPPEALDAESITLDVDEQSHILGPITEPIFYMPIPANWSNASFWVSGW